MTDEAARWQREYMVFREARDDLVEKTRKEHEAWTNKMRAAQHKYEESKTVLDSRVASFLRSATLLSKKERRNHAKEDEAERTRSDETRDSKILAFLQSVPTVGTTRARKEAKQAAGVPTDAPPAFCGPSPTVLQRIQKGLVSSPFVYVAEHKQWEGEEDGRWEYYNVMFIWYKWREEQTNKMYEVAFYRFQYPMNSNNYRVYIGWLDDVDEQEDELLVNALPASIRHNHWKHSVDGDDRDYVSAAQITQHDQMIPAYALPLRLLSLSNWQDAYHRFLPYSEGTFWGDTDGHVASLYDAHHGQKAGTDQCF